MIISFEIVFFLPVGASHLLAAVLNSLIVYCLFSNHKFPFHRFPPCCMVFAEPDSDGGGVRVTGQAELSSSYPFPVIRLHGLCVILEL